VIADLIEDGVFDDTATLAMERLPLMEHCDGHARWRSFNRSTASDRTWDRKRTGCMGFRRGADHRHRVVHLLRVLEDVAALGCPRRPTGHHEGSAGGWDVLHRAPRCPFTVLQPRSVCARFETGHWHGTACRTSRDFQHDRPVALARFRCGRRTRRLFRM